VVKSSNEGVKIKKKRGTMWASQKKGNWALKRAPKQPKVGKREKKKKAVSQGEKDPPRNDRVVQEGCWERKNVKAVPPEKKKKEKKDKRGGKKKGKLWFDMHQGG